MERTIEKACGHCMSASRVPCRQSIFLFLNLCPSLEALSRTYKGRHNRVVIGSELASLEACNAPENDEHAGSHDQEQR